jgi:hypothetical protein
VTVDGVSDGLPELWDDSDAPIFTFAPEDTSISNERLAVRLKIRFRQTRPRTLIAAFRPQRVARKPRLVRTDFVPTKLVIYAEDGEIKTRIEPQLTAAYVREPIYSN